jgi:hypothetical protein
MVGGIGQAEAGQQGLEVQHRAPGVFVQSLAARHSPDGGRALPPVQTCPPSSARSMARSNIAALSARTTASNTSLASKSRPATSGFSASMGEPPVAPPVPPPIPPLAAPPVPAPPVATVPPEAKDELLWLEPPQPTARSHPRDVITRTVRVFITQ